MKFVLPTYGALKDIDKEKAVDLFEKNKSFYHNICKLQIEKILS